MNKDVQSDAIISSRPNLDDQNNLNDMNELCEDLTCHFMDYEEKSYDSQKYSQAQTQK